METTEAQGDGYTLILMTAGSEEEAETIAQALVREELAACITLVPRVRSIYTWEGQVEVASECLLLVKTRASLFSPLAERVKAMHSYQVPEIISLPIGQGEARYLEWMDQVTRKIS